MRPHRSGFEWSKCSLMRSDTLGNVFFSRRASEHISAQGSAWVFHWGSTARRWCRSYKIDMMDGSEAAARAGLLIQAHALSRSGEPCLSVRHLSPLLTLTALLFHLDVVTQQRRPPGSYTADNSRSISYKNLHHSVYFGQFHPPTNIIISHSLVAELSLLSSICVSVVASVTPGADGRDVASDVTDVAIDLSSLDPNRVTRCTTFDWPEFHRQISLFDPARIVFGFKSRQDMLMFGDTIADPFMPSSRQLIRYAIQSGTWCQASRESDIVQGMQVAFLGPLLDLQLPTNRTRIHISTPIAPRHKP